MTGLDPDKERLLGDSRGAARLRPAPSKPCVSADASPLKTTLSAGSTSPAVKNAIIAGVISGLFAGMLGFTGASLIGNTPAPSISLPSTSGDTSPRADDSIAGIAQAVLPVVVSIDVSSDQGSGTGSGFIIRSTAKESFVLTNNHVVDGAGGTQKITVTFQDQTQAPATIVGTEASYDLAVLRIDRGNLPVAVLGDSMTSLSAMPPLQLVHHLA